MAGHGACDLHAGGAEDFLDPLQALHGGQAAFRYAVDLWPCADEVDLVGSAETRISSRLPERTKEAAVCETLALQATPASVTRFVPPLAPSVEGPLTTGQRSVVIARLLIASASWDDLAT